MSTASQTVVEEIVQSTQGPVTITTIVSSGSSLYTTFLNTAGQTVTEEIVQPTPFTTTISSGSSFYTASTILPDGQEDVEVIEPQPTTTTTSYTSTTTLYSATATGTDGTVTVTVVQPTPGMQYFGFIDHADHFDSSYPDTSKFNNDPNGIDIRGVFPGNNAFKTDDSGMYTFPGQSTSTDATDYAVVLEGYFFGPPGPYTLTLTGATDDYGFVWAGTKAYRGWTNDNADVKEHVDNGTVVDGSIAINLAEGQFVPVTIVWINVGGYGALEFAIYPPGGSETTDTTGYFVQPYSGDNFVYYLPTSG